jgi:hypothetical protein
LSLKLKSRTGKDKSEKLYGEIRGKEFGRIPSRNQR